MDIDDIVDNLDNKKAKKALRDFLKSYMNPAFGALPKNEIELIILNLLETIGAIDNNPEVYELVSKLKITRSKARSLIYSRELRSSSEKDLDQKVKKLLKRPLILKSGDVFVLEVENPLVSDHLRAKVKKLGYVSDGSFSPSIIKLGLDAISALAESYIDKNKRNDFKKILIDAGATDKSLKGLLKSAFKKIGKKIADDSGDAVMDKAAEFISPIFDSAIDATKNALSNLFDDK